MKLHSYALTLNWTGNLGAGTLNYRGYNRNYEISVQNKPVIQGSSDPDFSGDPTRYNPEELLLASVSSCHMLWYLHICSEEGVIVTSYHDIAKGTMEETEDGGGKFIAINLFPVIEVADESMIASANAAHSKANKRCFIANSLNFHVGHQPTCKAAK